MLLKFESLCLGQCYCAMSRLSPMKKKIFLRRVLHLFGSILGLSGVIFVIIKLNTYADQLDFSHFDSSEWVLIAVCSVIYGAANILLAFAWFDFLVFLGAGGVDRRWAMKVYGLSQLAKYVPGNIFHLAGRQAYGMAAGISAIPLAKSSILELGLIATVGGLFFILIAPFFLTGLPPLLTVCLFVATVTTVAICVSYFVSRNVAWALLWQTGFLVTSGSVFVGILTIVVRSHLDLLQMPLLCGAYVIAWLAGLVTPGAPAGIGIREAVLLFLLGTLVPHGDLLLAVLIGRIVTVLGDVVYFLVSYCLNVNISQDKNDYWRAV